jgi:RNAse (barnase) inhibitor barstar
MATFKQDPDEWQRLDWQLLQNSAVTLYFSGAILEADTSWFLGQGYRVLSVEAEAYGSPASLLRALGDVLAFPEYYGQNLNAFNDCLSDVDIPLEGGVLLVLHDFHAFAQHSRPIAQAILDILAENSRRFLMTGQRFLVLVHSTDPRITFEPVGATPVMWNPQEWLDSKRGL